jgi:hypothetical protein
VAILAVLLGLLLPAIQRVREAAAKSWSANNLRQIALACHHYAAAHGDRLPVDPTVESPGGVPWMWQLVVYADAGLQFGPEENGVRRVRMYQSPADPTIDRAAIGGPLPDGMSWDEMIPGGLTSYAGNWHVFSPYGRPRNMRGLPADRVYPADPPARLSASFPDGTSNTLLLAEHYARCDATDFVYNEPADTLSDPDQSPPYFGRGVDLVRAGNPPVTTHAPYYNRDHFYQPYTFQVRPCSAVRSNYRREPPPCGSRPRCDYKLNQTPHESGMLAALADGSVRTLNPGIRPEVFWSAVTPAGGEVLFDW